MGYTHYWRREVGTGKPEQFDELSLMVYNIRAMGEPTIDQANTEDQIGFNGEDLPHETFVWTQTAKANFDFCKTAGKPYDEVVTACLLAVASVYGDEVKVSSDGSSRDWGAGVRLFEEATRRKAPLDKIRTTDNAEMVS